MEKRKVWQVDDGWERLGNSAVGGGLPFLFLVVRQMFYELWEGVVKCLINAREKLFTRR